MLLSATTSRFLKVVASSSDGLKLFAVGQNTLYISTDSGTTWIGTTSIQSPPWDSIVSITSSSDGSKLVAVSSYEGIYVSTNGGSSWTQSYYSSSLGVDGPQPITSSSDGAVIAVCGGFGVRLSVNGGSSWKTTSLPEVGLLCLSITSSSDGSRLLLGGSASGLGVIYSSTDGGALWNKTFKANDSLTIAASSDGMKLVVAGYGAMYTSSDGGATWNQTLQECTFFITTPLTSSSDGSKLAVWANDKITGQPGIYTSTDSGATWTRTSFSAQYVNAMISSSDGSMLAAVQIQWSVGGFLPVSIDGGVNWRVAL